MKVVLILISWLMMSVHYIYAFDCPLPTWANGVEFYTQDERCYYDYFYIRNYELTAYTQWTYFDSGDSYCEAWRSLGWSLFLYDYNLRGGWGDTYSCYYSKNNDPSNLVFVTSGVNQQWPNEVKGIINSMPCWSSFSFGNDFLIRAANSLNYTYNPSDYIWIGNYAQNFCGSLFYKRYHTRLYNIGYNLITGLSIVLAYAHHDVMAWNASNHYVDCIECAEDKIVSDIAAYYPNLITLSDAVYIDNPVKDANGWISIIIK